jgi:hypothetical protein
MFTRALASRDRPVNGHQDFIEISTNAVPA